METIKIACIVAITALVSSVTTYQLTDREEKLPLAESPERHENTFAPRPSPESHSECSPQESRGTASSENIAREAPPPTTATPPAIGDHITGAPSSGESPIEIRQKLRQQQEHIDTVREFVRSHDPGTLITAVESRYASETVDYDWALQKEDELLTLFDNDDALAAFAPLDVSCKSVNCRLVMAVEDGRQADSIYRSLLAALTHDDQGQTVSSFNDPQNGQLVMYVSTDGGEELFNKD